MAIKKYINGSWVSASYRKYGTETDTITTLPTTVIGDGTPISSYIIKGNMEQDGAPTPSSPIYPSECGERTENLINVQPFTIESDGQSHYVPLWSGTLPVGTYTISLNQYNNLVSALRNTLRITIGGTTSYESLTSDYHLQSGQHLMTFTISDSSQSIDIQYWGNQLGNDCSYTNVMLVKGSTAPASYIPYGYKLPLTLGSTTTDIYLGEVQSERRIKKLVLTGEESGAFEIDSTNHIFALRGIFNSEPELLQVGGMCTHYKYNNAVSSLTSNMQNGDFVLNRIVNDYSFTMKDNSFNTADDFKSYLAAQYAAGTPVTVWYVLANPTTGIVNEPIRKIGDYVDSVSGTNLATSGTAQELDVETTLKPSEIDMTYHGWHEHEDTKYST